MERLNPMCFDPCNYFLKIQDSIGTPIPKMGTHLGVWEFIPSHFPTLILDKYNTHIFKQWLFYK
jgi:hypothetical protein